MGGPSPLAQVGNTTDGGLGFGWMNATDSEANPLDDAVKQQIANEVADDQAEESEDKEAILGNDILNPTTGARRARGGGAGTSGPGAARGHCRSQRRCAGRSRLHIGGGCHRGGSLPSIACF